MQPNPPPPEKPTPPDKPKPMSEYESGALRRQTIGLVINFVGFLAVIGSLSAAQLQLRQASHQTKIQIKDRTLANILTLDRVFLDHPELRPYFYEGKDITEKDPMYPRVVAVAEMHMDVFDYVLEYYENFPEQFPELEAGHKWIHDMFESSPITKRHFQAKKHWYSKRLRAFTE